MTVNRLRSQQCVVSELDIAIAAAWYMGSCPQFSQGQTVVNYSKIQKVI